LIFQIVVTKDALLF